MSLRAGRWKCLIGMLAVSHCDNISGKACSGSWMVSCHCLWICDGGLETSHTSWWPGNQTEKGINPQHPFQVKNPMTYLSLSGPHHLRKPSPLSNMLQAFERPWKLFTKLGLAGYGVSHLCSEHSGRWDRKLTVDLLGLHTESEAIHWSYCYLYLLVKGAKSGSQCQSRNMNSGFVALVHKCNLELAYQWIF